MKRSLFVATQAAAALTGALLLTTPSTGQETAGDTGPLAGITREEVLALLKQSDYETLDRRLNALQMRFEQDAGAEAALHDAFFALHSRQWEAKAMEPALDAWVERYPDSYAARLARGIFRTDQGLAARGTAYASKTSRRQFEQMERWFERGRADLNHSVGLSPKPLLSHMWLITQAARSRTDDGEERYYRTAIAYAPRSIELRAQHMINLQPRWGGSYEAMEAHARESDAVLGPGPEAARLHRLIAEDRGHVLMDREQYDAANTLYTETIERYGGVGVRCGRAWARVKLGRWPEAMQDMTAAMQEPGPHEQCADTAAWMAGQKSDYPGMFELVDGYLRHNPNHAGLLIKRGWVLQERGELAAAYRDYEIAAEQGNVWAQTMAGRYLFSGMGGVPVDKEKGLALFRAAAQTGDADARLCLVQALEALGRQDEAMAERRHFTTRGRDRPFTKPVEDASASPTDWLAYALDRRVQAVALGAVVMLLLVVRTWRRE